MTFSETCRLPSLAVRHCFVFHRGEGKGRWWCGRGKRKCGMVWQVCKGVGCARSAQARAVCVCKAPLLIL